LIRGTTAAAKNSPNRGPTHGARTPRNRVDRLMESVRELGASRSRAWCRNTERELPKEGTHPVSISPVAHSSAPPQQPPGNPPTSTASRVTPPATRISPPVQVTPANVSAAILQRAVGDGDGRTGAAALNDGDAAAQAAAQEAKAVDIRA
jgi:hypothetical protein